MKKLRRISLENFDELSSNEASRLIGGNGNDSIPPPRTIGPTPQPAIYGSITPGGGYSGGYNGNGCSIGLTISPGGESGSLLLDSHFRSNSLKTLSETIG